MATTYDQAVYGSAAASVAQAKVIEIPDANVSGNACTPLRGMAYTMMKGDLILCQNLDGSQSLYRYDAERSTVANPVLLKV